LNFYINRLLKLDEKSVILERDNSVFYRVKVLMNKIYFKFTVTRRYSGDE